MTELLKTSLYGAFLGLFLGVAYDVVRILRVMSGVSYRSEKSPYDALYGRGLWNLFRFGTSRDMKVVKGAFVFFTDLVYMLFATVCFVIFLFHFNYGIFRWFILLFVTLGFLLYYFTLGRLVIFFSREISELLKLLLNLVVFLFCLPFRYFGRFIFFVFKKTLLPLCAGIKRAIDRIKKKRYTDKCIKNVTVYVGFKV